MLGGGRIGEAVARGVAKLGHTVRAPRSRRCAHRWRRLEVGACRSVRPLQPGQPGIHGVARAGRIPGRRFARMRSDAGQATVEVALALPVLVMALLLVIQVGLVVRAQILVVHAAREGARAAAVGSAAGSAAASTPGLDPSRVSVSAAGGGGPGSTVTVTVRYRAETSVPLVGSLLGDANLTASVSMRVEGPPPDSGPTPS